MRYKTEISRRNYKAGYVVIKDIVDGGEFGGDDWEMSHAETQNGDYIGSAKDAYFLCKKRGIAPEKASQKHDVCSIGFCEKEQKWYGWSHRAIFGFGIGSKVKKGDCAYVAEKFGRGEWTAETLDDAKQMAMDFAEGVS